MALTRKSLKAMGLTDEQVESIIEMHTETIDGLKADVSKYKTDAEKLADVQKELNELKSKGDDGYKEKYEKEHKAFEDFKTEQTNKENRAAKEKAYRELLVATGISEKRVDSILKVSDLEKVELEDGKIKGADELTNNIKTEWADFIVSTQIEGAKTYNPPANMDGKPLTKADLYKKDERGRYVMSTAERQKALAENPNIN